MYGSRWKLYEIIDKNPALSIEELSKKINWSRRKIYRIIKKLNRDEMIKIKCFPVPMKEFIKNNKEVSS